MADFRQHIDISPNIKSDRLLNAIRKAQELDLKPFLGCGLYDDLVSCLDQDNVLLKDSPQYYTDLYKGCVYTNLLGTKVHYEGLTPALVYLALARFTESDAIYYTASGPAIKQQENALMLKPADIMKLVQQQRSIANACLHNIEKFLLAHQQQFPAWCYSSTNATARQPGPRIWGVDKTAFNTSMNENFNCLTNNL